MNAALRTLFATCVIAAGVAAPRSARAWYFPEHVAITTDAIQQLAPEVRDVLRAAVARAHGDGVSLCPAVEVGLEDLPSTRALHTPMLRAHMAVDCVPLTALPALAADHADGAPELRTVLAGSKGRELTTAAAFEWRRFLDAARRAPNEQAERMSFVHELDVDFYFIDPGYELRAQQSRAHFTDAGRSVDEVVRNAGLAGAVDNAVAQVLVHHLRSLQLAAAQRVAEALLEHGFALHFLEDAFASGHLVMTDATWSKGNTRARMRHDFFDASGLRVRRALAAEPCAALDDSFEPGPSPCWTTWGDGHLGIARDSSDRVHVVRAVRKAQLQLALAFDPARMLAFFDGLGEREQIALGDFFDPTPWWTLPPTARRARPATAAYARSLVAASASAVERLRRLPALPIVNVGSRTRGPIFPADVVSRAIDPCEPIGAAGREAAPGEDRDADREGDREREDADSACGAGRAPALGTVGASLLRPLLVELPASEDDVSTLHGEAPTDHGVAFQLLASASTAALFPGGAPIDLYVPALGVSMGIAYRFGTYLPGRRNRSAIELNAGIFTSLHFDTRGHAGGHPHVTMLEQEIRWPILWEALTSYVLPLDLQKSHTAGSVIALGGARVREVLTDPTPRFWGIDFEIVALALSSGRGAYPLYSVSPEVRLHVGFADASVLQPALAGTWGPTIGLTLTGGYATLF